MICSNKVIIKRAVFDWVKSIPTSRHEIKPMGRAEEKPLKLDFGESTLDANYRLYRERRITKEVGETFASHGLDLSPSQD